MRVRGKIKSIENIPERFKCCNSAISGIIETAGAIFDLNTDDIKIEITSPCPACGKKYLPEKGFLTSPLSFLPMDVVDLEEGGV